MRDYVYTARLVYTGDASLLQMNPLPGQDNPVQTISTGQTIQTSGSGRWTRSPGEILISRHRLPCACPCRLGYRGVPWPPGWHSPLAPFVPLKSPSSRITHVSSKCCSKVASISPAVQPGQDPAGSSFSLRHRPPALRDHMTPAGCGLRTATAPPKGQTSRRSLCVMCREHSLGSRRPRPL